MDGSGMQAPLLQPSGSFVAAPFPNLGGPYGGYGGYFQPQFNYQPAGGSSLQSSHQGMGASNPANQGYDMPYTTPGPQPGPYGFTPSGLPQMGLPPLQQLGNGSLLPYSGSFTLNGPGDDQMMNPMMTQGYGNSPRNYGAYGGGAGPFIFYTNYDEKLTPYDSKQGSYSGGDKQGPRNGCAVPSQGQRVVSKTASEGPEGQPKQRPVPAPKQMPKTREARVQKKRQPRKGCLC